MAREFGGLGRFQPLGVVQLGEVVVGDTNFFETCPAGLCDEFVAVLVGVEPDGCGFDAHGEVFGHHGDATSLVVEGLGHGQDASVVVSQAEPWWEYGVVDVVHFDAERSAGVFQLNGLVELTVFDAQIIEATQCGSGKIPEFTVVAFPFKF